MAIFGYFCLLALTLYLMFFLYGIVRLILVFGATRRDQIFIGLLIIATIIAIVMLWWMFPFTITVA